MVPFGIVRSLAPFFDRVGADVAAVSDVTGGLADEEGLDVDRLVAHVDEVGDLSGFDGGRDISAGLPR